MQVIEIRIPPLRERREEIPALVEFSRRATRSMAAAGEALPLLLEALVNHSWPGNIRELENMMKRFVVLREEELILSELAYIRHVAATNGSAHPAPVQAPAPVEHVAPPAVAAAAPESAPEPAAFVSRAEPVKETHEIASTGSGGVDLQSLARSAAMRAEREAIEQALARFRWNRRKTAEYLSVSYKTLLNKMKVASASPILSRRFHSAGAIEPVPSLSTG